MILEKDIFSYVVIIEKFSSDQIERMRYLSNSLPVCNADEIIEYLEAIKEIYQNNDYSNTILKTVSHTIRTLYVFLSINDLNYNPEIASIWYDFIAPLIGNSCLSWRRVLAVLSEYISGEKILFDKKYFPKIDRMSGYPDWCKSAIEGYFKWLIRSFHDPNTVRSYKYSVFCFCDYILTKSLNSFDDLSIDLIKDFLHSDTHTTFKGYSTRVTNVKQFVTFMEDNDFVTLKTLHMALHSGVAKEDKIVDVLSDIEIETVYKYKETSKAPAELRNIAMVLIGLRMGLRSSDVVNLKMTDIHWKESIVSIVQTKTHAAITLPDGNVSMQSIALGAAKVPFLRKSKKVREIIGEDDFAALLSAPPNYTRFGIRDQALMILLYDSAIRVNELLDEDKLTKPYGIDSIYPSTWKG